MKTVLRRALVTLVALAALALIVPGQAMAAPWCNICDDTGDCFACCKCDGFSTRQCVEDCPFGFAAAQATFLANPACDAPLMSVALPADQTVENEVADAEPVDARAAEPNAAE
ncbi:MAG: hypothetical protein MI919_29370 [Holophagales bacterium]|nr:hypothetical protein [Holophagales bacterium]